MHKEDSPNEAGDYFSKEEVQPQSKRKLILSSLGAGAQVSVDDPLEPTRRIMPAFMEAKWARRTKLGYPLTVTNRKAYADPITAEEFASARIIEQHIEQRRPTKANPEPPKRTFALVRTEGDRAKWVEVIENAKKE